VRAQNHLIAALEAHGHLMPLGVDRGLFVHRRQDGFRDRAFAFAGDHRLRAEHAPVLDGHAEGRRRNAHLAVAQHGIAQALFHQQPDLIFAVRRPDRDRLREQPARTTQRQHTQHCNFHNSS